MPKKHLFELDYDYLGHEMPRSEVRFPKFKLSPPPYGLYEYHDKISFTGL
jgi:hypothetical protein